MESIFSKVSLPSIPVDLLATLRIFFEKGTLQNKTLFEQLYVDRWFDYNLPQMGLTAEAIMASYKVRFMASIIGNDAATPLRPSDGFKTFTGEIPRMGQRFPMSANKLRKMLTILEASSKRYTDQQKFNEVYKLLMGDVREAYLGCKDTADHIILQALSNGGVAEFTPQLNNPDGIRYKVDYSMPERNKLTAAKAWTKENAATVNPFEELAEIKYQFEAYGITFGEILVAPALYAWIINNPNVRRAIKGNDRPLRLPSLMPCWSSLNCQPLPKSTSATALPKTASVLKRLSTPTTMMLLSLSLLAKSARFSLHLRTMPLSPKRTLNTLTAATAFVWPSGRSAKAQGRKLASTHRPAGVHCLSLPRLTALLTTKSVTSHNPA